jgi:branched-chain amino acid aminotransferase
MTESGHRLMPAPWPVWWNGRLVPAAEATLPATAPATVHGLGTFETLRADHGRIFRPEAHWQRLNQGCRELHIPGPSLPEFRSALRELAGAAALPALRLRFSVLDTGTGSAAWLAVAHELHPLPPARLVMTDFRLASPAPLGGSKPSAYAMPMILQRKAIAAGGSDAVVLAADGSVAEAAMANVFAVRSGQLMTPPLVSGCLPGITRNAVIDCCRALGLPAPETRITTDDLMAADEIFLTSSLRRIQPVAALGQRVFSPVPGPVTTVLQQALEALTARESVTL